MLCIGHRGARGHAPENTLLSVHTALELGARAIEIDVHLCEGVPVVIHDDSVDRTTNGHGMLSQHTLHQLRALDAEQGQLDTLEQAIEAFLAKFNNPGGEGAVVKLDQERELRQQGA